MNLAGAISRTASQINNLVEAHSPEDVKTIVCVLVKRSKTGSYTDGAAAYIITWTVRLVSWPDGQVVGENTFVGGKPPRVKIYRGDGYGSNPIKVYRQWLLNLFAGDSVYVQGSAVVSIAFSPDGKYMAVAGSDYGANIWDLSAHKLLYTQTGEKSSSAALIPLAFSADQKLLAMGTLGGVNLLADTIWKRRAEVRGVDVLDVVFSGDGSRMVAGMSRVEKGIRIYDSVNGSQSGNYALQSPISQVLLSPGDEYLIGLVYSCPTCPNNPETGIFVWDFKSSQLISNIKVASAQSMALLGDGKTLAISAARINDVLLYDFLSGMQVGSLKSHPDVVTHLAASPDGKWLASSDAKATVIVWDQATMQIWRTFTASDTVSSLAFSADGNQLAIGTQGGVVEMWKFQESPS